MSERKIRQSLKSERAIILVCLHYLFKDWGSIALLYRKFIKII